MKETQVRDTVLEEALLISDEPVDSSRSEYASNASILNGTFYNVALAPGVSSIFSVKPYQ